jgi:methylmalonyl-CoA mutase
MYDLLKEKDAGYIKIFGGGGGTILPEESEELHNYGITRLYSPEDGRKMGLQGMINDLLQIVDFDSYSMVPGNEVALIQEKNIPAIARIISLVENSPQEAEELIAQIDRIAAEKTIAVLGITGTGGAGKSSLTDELVRRFLIDFDDPEGTGKTIAIMWTPPSAKPAAHCWATVSA